MRRFFPVFRPFSSRLMALRTGALLACAMLTACAAGVPTPTPRAMTAEQKLAAEQDAKFATFVRDFKATATAAGIKASVYDRAMSGINRNARVQQLNEKQPEFAKQIWEYLDGAVSETRITKGQEMLAAYPTVLANLETRYGVPKEILIAVWGLESNYGTLQGSFNMFEALATLAYDGARTDYARRELIAALKMMQQNGYAPSQMTSSWAGAFGNTQFVPSTFLDLAVDGDGDGQIDLWRSPADALASAAHLLANAGWDRGKAWGYEVTLPKGFAYENAEVDNKKPVSEWKRLGIVRANGLSLPDIADQASIFVPAGARGPAFLLLPNFYVILKYNNASSYAIAIGHLADRLRGGSPLIHGWPRAELPLSRDQRFQLQRDLKALGYDPGAIDGLIGKNVRAALRGYQKDRGMTQDGFATLDLLARMDDEVAKKKPN